MTRTLSTARMHREGTYNFTKQFVAPGLASAVEVYVAIVGACLPTLIPIYRKLRYGHPNTPQRSIPVDGIVTIGKLSNRTPFGSGVEGSSEKLNNEEDITFNPYRGSCQVSISGQGKRFSFPPDSLEHPLQGIVVKQDVTWSENA
ncbi:hypothetical protein F4815DRAFT_445434 [Daldinia loculata]|nr:hypothetical protein F4815DRAFT_445434 [Daldinia loculata]